MTVHKATARKLATQSEWQLLEPSFGSAIKEITPGRLKQKVTRARKLQDKYRDLARQQRGEARGKRRAKSTRAAEGNENTRVKQEMFSDALERYEAQLARLEAKAEKEAARSSKVKKSGTKTTARTSAAKKATPKTTKKTAKTAARKTTKKVAKKASRPPAKRAAKKAAKRGVSPWSPAAESTATARQVMSHDSRAARKQTALSRQSAAAHQGHVGARGRRRQARRDSQG